MMERCLCQVKKLNTILFQIQRKRFHTSLQQNVVRPTSVRTLWTSSICNEDNINQNNTTENKFKSVKVLSRPKTRQPVKPISKNVNKNQVCMTYATADHYSFTALIAYASQDVRLNYVDLPREVTNAALFKTNNCSLLRCPGHGFVFFFREGAISFWNISDKGINEIMHLTRKFEEEPYQIHLVSWESEQIDYRFHSNMSKFQKNHFLLCDTNDFQLACAEMYAFSHALVVSVKLAHWEHSLDKLIKSIESLPHELMVGRKLQYRTTESVLQKIGEVFMIRHRLNLQYNLLDVPDVYWDREDLEHLYVKTTEFLNIIRRVKIMNEKLSYCAHMVELVKSHLAEQKSIRIEILIVLLILIEVSSLLLIYFMSELFIPTGIVRNYSLFY
ncbi:required for meiotic nuclear division protein 1 homolog isoform X1 [Ciona intestinalis]